MVRNILAAMAIAGAASRLAAVPLAARVVDAFGHPLRYAVVTLYPRAGAARGADVSFPNLDPTKHDVYSFSPAKKFELKLFARDQSRTVHFDKSGLAALGRNIHAQMSAFVVVADSPWTAKTDARGMVLLADAPDAAGRVIVWRPYLRARASQVEQIVGPAQRSASFQVRLRPAPAAMPMADY